MLPFTFPHLIKLAMNTGTELAVNYFGLSVCQNRTYSSPSHFLLNLSRGVLCPRHNTVISKGLKFESLPPVLTTFLAVHLIPVATLRLFLYLTDLED